MDQPVLQERTAEQLLRLHEAFADNAEFKACVESLAEGGNATFDSVWGSSCALLCAAIAKQLSPLLVVVNDGKAADRLLDDLPTVFDRAIDLFPACLPRSSNSLAIDLEFGDRLRLVKSLMAGEQSPIMVTTVDALMQPVPAASSLQGNVRRIVEGDQIDVEEFVVWLNENGFHHTSAVELPGEYSHRGGILDVFAADWIGPVRVELFDDEVESLRQFDTATQRSVASLSQIEISVFDQTQTENGHLASYLPNKTIVLYVEPDGLREQADRSIERSSNPDQMIGWEQTQKELAHLAAATASYVSSGHLGARWQLPVESVEQFSGDIGDLRLQVDRIGVDPSGKPADVFVIARIEGELDRVNEILSSTAAFQAGRIHLSVGCVHEGYRLRDQQAVIVGCDQMFHRTELRRRGRKKLGKAIDSFMDLREGDSDRAFVARDRSISRLEDAGQG